MVERLSKEQIMDLIEEIGTLEETEINAFAGQHGLNIRDGMNSRLYSNYYEDFVFCSIMKFLRDNPNDVFDPEFSLNLFHNIGGYVPTIGLKIDFPEIKNIFISEPLTDKGLSFDSNLFIIENPDDYLGLSPREVFEKIKTEEPIPLIYSKVGRFESPVLSDLVGYEKISFSMIDVFSQLALKTFEYKGKEVLAIFRGDYGDDFIERDLGNIFLTGRDCEIEGFKLRGDVVSFMLIKACDVYNPSHLDKFKEVYDELRNIVNQRISDNANDLEEKINLASHLIQQQSGLLVPPKELDVFEEKYRPYIEKISKYY